MENVPAAHGSQRPDAARARPGGHSHPVNVLLFTSEGPHAAHAWCPRAALKKFAGHDAQKPLAFSNPASHAHCSTAARPGESLPLLGGHAGQATTES